MKNVAKCDTWCELQNPVNHRVFERKLRPRLLGRGHACLGVMPHIAQCPPPPKAIALGSGGADAEIDLPCLAARRVEMIVAGRVGHGEWWTDTNDAERCVLDPKPKRRVQGAHADGRSRTPSDHDPRSGGATR